MGNGLGPWWFPDIWRRWLTALSSLFFSEAAWVKHDEGYAAGQPPRADCDWLFLAAMMRDASRTTRLHRMIACIALAFFFYTSVRAFGWLSYARTRQGEGSTPK